MEILSCNENCDWYKLQSGAWIAASLIDDASPVLATVSALSNERASNGTVQALPDAEAGSSANEPLQVLTHMSYTDSGWFHIVGEVRNNTSAPMTFVKVVATLYDDGGIVVGTDYTYTDLGVIPPGGKAPFETATDHWPNFNHYDIQVEGS